MGKKVKIIRHQIYALGETFLMYSSILERDLLEAALSIVWINPGIDKTVKIMTPYNVIPILEEVQQYESPSDVVFVTTK